MKRLFSLIALCIFALSAHAQMAPAYNDDFLALGSEFGIASAAPGATSLSNSEDLTLLQEQNKLLNNRRIETIVAVSGIGTVGVGGLIAFVGAVADADGLLGVGITGVVLGGVTTIGSAIFLGINGTKLLENQTKINNNLILKINPSGLALQF